MAENDVEALALLIKYCKEEATRLGLSTVGIQCLRMASEEFIRSTTTPAAKGQDNRSFYYTSLETTDRTLLAFFPFLARRRFLNAMAGSGGRRDVNGKS
jgi:hypothetical protein